MSALAAQFGAVLSLLSAHTVSGVVPQKAGLFGGKPRLRSAFTGGMGVVFMLLSGGQSMMAQPDAHSHVPGKWGIHLRAADPGIWSLAASAQGHGKRSKGGGWQAYLQCDQGRMVQGRAQHWLRLDDQTLLGSGVELNSQGIGSLLLSVGVQDWGAHITIPLLQPSPRPLNSMWQWSARFPLWQKVRGVADLQWFPGALPRISLTAMASQWTAGAGSNGAWLSFGRPIEGHDSTVEWRMTVGVLRGDIPWVGLDCGSLLAFGSDPLQFWHLRWLWP